MVLLPQKSRRASRHIWAKCRHPSGWLRPFMAIWTPVRAWGRFSSGKTPERMSCVEPPSTSTGPSRTTMRLIPLMPWWSPGLTLRHTHLRLEAMALKKKWVARSFSTPSRRESVIYVLSPAFIRETPSSWFLHLCKKPRTPFCFTQEMVSSFPPPWCKAVMWSCTPASVKVRYQGSGLPARGHTTAPPATRRFPWGSSQSKWLTDPIMPEIP